MTQVTNWFKVFNEFVDNVRINSKEIVDVSGEGAPLVLWESQKRFLKEVATGLNNGIHFFVCLKSRQLGVTTISLLIDIVWLCMHPGMTCALVTENEKNRNKNRAVLKQYIASLQAFLGEGSFYIVKGGDNRDFMKFSNGSRIDFLVAGTKNKGTSWGEGEGYAFVHATEVSAYGSVEGLKSFEEAFSQTNPNRLFIYESTAKGMNHFYDTYQNAKKDPYSKRAFFVGWWASKTNVISRKDPRFLIYSHEPSGEELEKIKLVQQLYDHTITPEQLAWIRWKEDNAGEDGGILDQNQPWTDKDAFIQSGYSFFQMRALNKRIKEIEEAPDGPVEEGGFNYKPYRYELGNHFMDLKLVDMHRELVDGDADPKDIELRIWEEPRPEGRYVIGGDPAYGRNDWKDRSAFSVWRCYADRLVQVAEFASNRMEVEQAAWILAHLCGAYRDCIANIELQGPGRCVMKEWDHVRALLSAEYNAAFVSRMGWEDAFGNARWYLYHRPDSMGTGYAANFECLALDTLLPTPTGWTTMGQVQEGDFLLADTGEPTRVIGVSNVKIGAKCYEIEFDDGTKIVADEDHWWKVARRHWKGGADKLRQTKQLEAGKFYIRPALPLAVPDVQLPVDPYLLGVWLGDGSSDAAVVTAGEQDVEDICANIEGCGQPIRRTQHRNRTIWQIRLNEGNNGSRGNPFLHGLRELGVLKNKHIPAIYLRGSFEQRLALLQGLMDTDGSSGGNGGGQCSFVTTFPALASGFAELVRTLGFKAKFLTWDESPAKGSQCALRYQFWFTAHSDMPVFRLRRKQDKVDRSVRKPNRQCHRIVSVKEVESVPVRCVMVDGPTKMYLAGEGMIPTHNTSWRNQQEIMHQLKNGFMSSALEIRSIPLLLEMSNVVQDGPHIGAPETSNENGKDDRVFGAALANRAWIDWRRIEMISLGLTYERVHAEEAGSATATSRSLNGLVYRFFRTMEERAAMAEEPPSWRRDKGLE